MFQMAGDEQGGSLPVRNDRPGKGCQEQGRPTEAPQGRGEDTCTDQPREPGGGGWGGELGPQLGALSSPQSLSFSPSLILDPSLLPAAQKSPGWARALSFSGRLFNHSSKVLLPSQSLGATRGARRCFPRWGKGAGTVPSGHPAPAPESSMRLMRSSPLHLDVSR